MSCTAVLTPYYSLNQVINSFLPQQVLWQRQFVYDNQLIGALHCETIHPQRFGPGQSTQCRKAQVNAENVHPVIMWKT